MSSSTTATSKPEPIVSFVSSLKSKEVCRSGGLGLKALLWALIPGSAQRRIELGNLSRLRKASGDESLTGRIADVLGVSAEEAAKLPDQPPGWNAEGTEEGTP